MSQTISLRDRNLAQSERRDGQLVMKSLGTQKPKFLENLLTALSGSKQYFVRDLLHLLENTFDRKRINANSNSNSKPNTNPNPSLPINGFFSENQHFCEVHADSFLTSPLLSMPKPLIFWAHADTSKS